MTSSPFPEQIAAAVRATEIHRLWAWSWFGERETLIAPTLRSVLSAEMMRAHLVTVVQRRLYSHFYCTGFAVRVEGEPPGPSSPAARATFAGELARANTGAGFVEGGWVVAGRRGAQLLVRRNGLTLAIDEADLVHQRGGSFASGTTVARRMPKELRFAAPGFVMVMGDKFLSNHGAPLIRSYWNVKAEGAAPLVAAVTSRLNRSRVPFRLKVVDDPARFSRCDAAILYTAKNDYSAVARVLAAAHREVEAHLGSETPALTKRVAVGLGIAEDPACGASFGEHRCGVLAEAFVRAFEQGQRRTGERSRIVRECFGENGISLERPYLNPGSEDVFALRQARSRPSMPRGASPSLERDRLLETTIEIGEAVARSAVWHRDRCTWLAPGLPRDGGHAVGTAGLVYRPLASGIYGGTSGVSLFLAELAACTGDRTVRDTSIGAVRQALSTSPLDESPSLGLYEGGLGVALTAAYVGTLLDEADLLARAAMIVEHALGEERTYECADLLTGNAGAIVALLVLSELLHDPGLTVCAIRLGGELLGAAQLQDGLASWSSASFPTQRNLLGLSHGTAGVAYALLELYGVTGDAAYRRLAESALAYERSWYVPDAQAWPDFRGVPARARANRNRPPLPVFWCHGAAGIALSRLHAHAILEDESYRTEALTALSTTRHWTECMLDERATGFSLCHGLAGNAEILATGSRLLGDGFADGAELAARVACEGIRHYAGNERRWPFDALGRGSPSLMLGLGGVGHFYLRLYDPEVPSLLLLDRDALMRRSASGR